MASIDNMGNTGATLPHLQGENTNENSASALDSQDALIDIESIDTPAVLEASDFSDAPQNQHPDKRDPSEGANP
jgi:hypothetical protein